MQLGSTMTESTQRRWVSEMGDSHLLVIVHDVVGTLRDPRGGFGGGGQHADLVLAGSGRRAATRQSPLSAAQGPALVAGSLAQPHAGLSCQPPLRRYPCLGPLR